MAEGKGKITTIKLLKSTKTRLDHLKVYHRETYDEILTRMLELLNICRVNPKRARYHLITMEKQRKHHLGLIEPVPVHTSQTQQSFKQPQKRPAPQGRNNP